MTYVRPVLPMVADKKVTCMRGKGLKKKRKIK
jgi:hypothetical protein